MPNQNAFKRVLGNDITHDNFQALTVKKAFSRIVTCHNLMVSSSVTRFGEILPLWHNFKSLGQIFEGLFSIWQSFNLTLAKMLCYWASFHRCRWPHT